MIHGGGLLCLLLAPRLNVTSVNHSWITIFPPQNKEDRLSGRVFGVPMTSPESQQQPTPSALVVAQITRSQPRYHCFDPINPTWHPSSSCFQPARPWLHRLKLNISSLTKGSRAPGATIFSQLGAPSRHVGTGPSSAGTSGSHRLGTRVLVGTACNAAPSIANGWFWHTWSTWKVCRTMQYEEQVICERWTSQVI